MNPAGVPARLLWVVDREAIENGSVPRALRGGVRWLYLRDPTPGAVFTLADLGVHVGPKYAA